MSKIVVLANPGDEDTIKTALSEAGFEVQVVEPTPANLLHIVIGMVDDSSKESKEKNEKKEDDKEKSDEKTEVAPDSNGEISSDEEVQESKSNDLGFVFIEGVQILAKRGTGSVSTLFVENLKVSAKTTYTINEANVSFWPKDLKNLEQRFALSVGDKQAVTSGLSIRESKDGSYILIGSDLSYLFE